MPDREYPSVKIRAYVTPKVQAWLEEEDLRYGSEMLEGRMAASHILQAAYDEAHR